MAGVQNGGRVCVRACVFSGSRRGLKKENVFQNSTVSERVCSVH